GEADIHGAGALGAEDRVLWQPGGDVAQGPKIIGRRLVIMDLRPDLRRVLIRLLRNHLPPRRVLRIEPLRSASAWLSCPTIALPSPTSATSVALLWPISSGEMSSWMTLTSFA